jgi:hypothetical protein
MADNAHVNDHGGRLAEAEFWDKHGKNSQHGYVETMSEPIGHVTAKKESGAPVTGTLL